MAERDYKVVYKSRVLDRDEERPRIPTAFDPYDIEYAKEPRRRQKYSSRGDDDDENLNETNTTEVARSANRTVYSTRDSDRDRDDYVDTRRSSRAPTDNVSVRRSAAVDQPQRDNPVPRRSESVTNDRNRDQTYINLEVDRPRERGRDYYIDDTPRPIGAPYVIDARNVIDITIPSRLSDRGYDRDGGRYRYDDSRLAGNTAYGKDYTRNQYSKSTGDVRGSNTIVTKKDYRSQYDENDRSSRVSVRDRDNDRDEDWRLVDSMRDTRISSNQPPPPQDKYTDRRSRSRVQTYSSEDDYVMVSPKARAPPSATGVTRESSTRRSAIARSDYPDPERKSRRSRSISFRGSQVEHHDVSERKHERPGAEAQICGTYLGRPMSEFDERSSVAYSSYDRRGDDRRARGGDADRDRDRDRDRYVSQVTYRERDEPYPPQSGFDPVPKEKKRERSRRRRRHDDDDSKDREVDDDQSYYSENIVKTTTRETKYR